VKLGDSNKKTNVAYALVLALQVTRRRVRITWHVSAKAPEKTEIGRAVRHTNGRQKSRVLRNCAMQHLVKVVADVAALTRERQTFKVVAPRRVVISDAVGGAAEQFHVHHQRTNHEACATLARLAVNSNDVLGTVGQVTGGTHAKTLDHNQRRAVVILKRKMRNHHVKILGVIKALGAKIVNLICARVLGVKKPHNLRYGVAVESFDLRQFGFSHCRFGIVGKVAYVSAGEAHRDDIFLEPSQRTKDTTWKRGA
jgi:hypothetical protein